MSHIFPSSAVEPEINGVGWVFQLVGTSTGKRCLLPPGIRYSCRSPPTQFGECCKKIWYLDVDSLAPKKVKIWCEIMSMYEYGTMDLFIRGLIYIVAPRCSQFRLAYKSQIWDSKTHYIYIYLLGLDFGFHDFTFPCHWGLPNEHRYTDISHESPSLQRPAKARRTAALRSQNHRAEYLLQSSKVWHPVPLSHSWLMDVYFPKYGNDIMIGLDPSP